MKRGMAGGASRGPVAPTRQRRTIRLVQILLLGLAVGLVWFAFAGSDGDMAQTIVSLVVATVALAAAWSLSDGPSVRVPTPARLDELAGRAESVALEKAGD
ncbi:MAG TPA: hypothetical protein VG929_03425 [Actinomycetota bacterium]|nr:hypothetical protein [Actinomycetota bacterium]